MFWGLIMEPQKRYTQNIEKAFRVTMAALDIANTDGQPSQLMCNYEGRNYLLCTLQESGILQCSLDLYFEEGTIVSFATNGKSHIHLTGYLTRDIEDEFEDDSEEEQENEELVPSKKKTRAKDNKNDQPLEKKLKIEDVEEEESDDSDFDMEKMLKEEQSDEEEDSDEEEATEGEEGSEDEENVEEEEESSGIEESDKEEVQIAKVNGLSKKTKKAKVEKATPPTPQKGKRESLLKQQTPGPKVKKEEQTVESAKKGKQGKQTPNSKRKSLPGGVIIEDLKEGQGEPANNGNFVQVYYQGQLQSSGKVFDKTMNGPGFGFRLGNGEVIKGWDVGVKGMKVGGKRRIICPPHLAYGSKGSPPVIPPNSTLVFEVEMKKVK